HPPFSLPSDHHFGPSCRDGNQSKSRKALRMVRHQAAFPPCDTSAGSRSCLNPPGGTKTSGGGSKPPRMPARTLPLVLTLLPRASASPSPGRPTQSLPPPDVDSQVTPAASASLATPSVADGSCQHSSARTMAAWPPCKEHGRDCRRTSAGSDEVLTR